MRANTRVGLAALALSGLIVGWGSNTDAKSKPKNASVQALPCGDVKVVSKAKKVRQHEDSIRASAQKGLDFLTEATVGWQKSNNCMGCHVQGVAGEALAVGRHHQYEVAEKDLDTVFKGLLDLSGGIRTEQGHAAKGSSLRA